LFYLSICIKQNTGILLGVALRNGAAVYFPLPPMFYYILSNTELPTTFTPASPASPKVANLHSNERSSSNSIGDVDKKREAVTQTMALAIRNGIISTFPEVS
jgi:hypothetical protein